MLSAREIEHFFADGYLVRPGVFDAAEIRAMRRAFGRLERTARSLGGTRMHGGASFVLARGPADSLRIERIVWCGAVERVLSEFGRDPRLLAMAARLLGSGSMNQLINQAHFKLPGDGVEFPWHQDSTHRRYGRGEWIDANGRGSYVQTVVAVDDMTEDNGPLQFIPGSCKLGHVPIPESEEGRLPAVLEDADVASVTAPAGSVVLFGPYTFHRSMPNRSDRPRRVFINGYAYPGANSRVYPGRGAGRLLRAC